MEDRELCLHLSYRSEKRKKGLSLEIVSISTIRSLTERKISEKQKRDFEK